MCNQLLTCRSPTNKCLCPNGSFRYNNTCYTVEQLKVTEIKNTFDETSLNLTWKPPNLGANFSYNVSLNSGLSNGVTVPSTRFEGLAPGTLYTVSVVTSVLRDPGYSSTGVEYSPNVSNSFYTKPAMPGPLSASVYLGPNVNLTFTKSVGGVAFYIVTVTQRESGRQWTKNISSQSDPVRVELANQTAGAYYNVTIIAYSGGISSDTRTATYRVEVDVAGGVTELNVTQSGSRWVHVKWRPPTNPNGEILGYTVTVARSNNSTCVSGVAVLCSNCSELTLKQNSTSLKMPDVSNCTKNDSKKQTYEELKSDMWQEVNVTSLSPYVTYQVTVVAVNEKGRGQESNKDFKTQSEAAENLVSLTVEEPGTVGQLNITWVPGEETGNTSYNVTWFEESSIGSGEFNIYKGGSILSGYTQNKYTIRGLLSYWKYLVSVRPSTEIGLSPEENHTVARTLDSAPGEVEIFNISQPSDSATYLQFTVSCPNEKERNGVILFFVVRASVPANETLGSVSVTNGCKQNYTFNAPVKAETNYTLEAFANTSKHEGISKTNKFYVAPRAPTLTVDPDFGGSLLKDASGVTQTSAVINICPCLVTDRSQGNITLAGLIVCKGNCETSTSSDPNHFRSGVMTWKQFKDKGYEGSYRPTPDDWHETQHVGSSRRKRSTLLSRSIRATLNPINFTLGDDVNCEQKDNSVYCNGPLPPGYTFA
ncbi:receptor-type tyrosine-protein phosphatase eta-like [Pomacea canaliculata]|uniref:receptor-type tyrosine-protein phosphatase eta-like n=1 Tax=Pomacea canaliculata TaxID=400727 RepID=UPI000D738EA4|nr:receptor-type tyrosine-protein phosphatase eta-like [Pomacea canaliculata]